MTLDEAREKVSQMTSDELCRAFTQIVYLTGEHAFPGGGKRLAHAVEPILRELAFAPTPTRMSDADMAAWAKETTRLATLSPYWLAVLERNFEHPALVLDFLRRFNGLVQGLSDPAKN